MPDRLGAVAADGHVAPGPAFILAAVDEQPAAIAADLHPLRIWHGDQPQDRMGHCRIEPLFRCPAQGARQSLQQFGEQPVVVPLEHALSEVSVRRFAQLDEVRSILRSNGRYVAEKYPFGAERSRCRWEALHLPFGLEAVDAARRIVTQDDAVGDIERQCAAGKTVKGPGEAHEKNITGKTHFASYYFKAIWSVGMAYLLQQLANAVPLAALYATLAFGYSIAFGVTKRADITYGAIIAFAGQMLLLFTDMAYNRLWLVLPAAIAVGVCASLVYSVGAGVWIGRFVMQPLVSKSPNTVIVAALGMMIVLMETARLAANTRAIWLPPLLNDNVTFWSDGTFKVTLTYIQLLDTALMCAIIAIGAVILKRTAWGRLWRAVIDDPLAAELCGTSASRVFLVSYGAAALVATCCGILATFYYGSMDFGAGLMFGLKVLLIAAVGGYSDPLRSAGGAAGLALVETLWGAYGSFIWRDLAIFSLLVFLLVLSRRERVVL